MTPTTRPTRIKDIMVKEVVSLAPEDTVAEAVEVMTENGLSTLPVVDGGGHCVGMFAAVDVLASALNQAPLANSTVEGFMATNIAFVDPESTVQEAAQTMLLNQVHHLAAVDKHQHVVGILSTMDLLQHFTASD